MNDLQGELQLRNNGTDTLRITKAEAGSSLFSFSKQLEEGNDYNVMVFADPAHQTCTLRDDPAASGTMGTTDVDVIVDCVFNTYSIGGTVSGLNGTLELILNEGLDSADEIVVTTEDTYTFGDHFAAGFEYTLAIKTQPAGQECALNLGSFVNEDGEEQTPQVTGPVSVAVTCEDAAAPERTLSVTVEGLPEGTTVAMRAFGPEDGRWPSETKAFGSGTGSFNNTMRDGEEYDFRVFGNPDGYTCLIDGSTFTFGAVNGDVTITVTCTEDSGGGGPGGPGDDECDEFDPFCDGDFPGFP